MAFTLLEVAQIVGAQCPDGMGHVSCTQASIDTRTLRPGAVFFALPGVQVDGHDFVEAAREAGAACAVVQRDVETALPCVWVNDVHAALKALASAVRAQIKVPVLAVTGSCGKTSTKNFMGHIMRQVGSVLATQGNFNNLLGLPLTLCRYAGEDAVVLELGTGQPGEIKTLCEMAKPTVAVVTLVDGVHLKGFGHVDAIAHEKGQIYVALAQEGVGVIHGLSPYREQWVKMAAAAGRLIVFDDGGDVYASQVKVDAKGHAGFVLHAPDGSAPVKLKLLGEHHVHNALAAAACAHAVGVSVKQIAQGLSDTEPEQRRGIKSLGRGGCMVIDDSYNASPRAVRAALKVLMGQPGRHVAVLGDMLEMADQSQQAHFEIGQVAQDFGVDAVYLYGPESRQTAKGYGAQAQHFDDMDDLISALEIECQPDTTILIKASNGMKLDRVVESLVQSSNQS